MNTRWKDFDTSTDEDRARAAKEREPIAWAVRDKIGSVVCLAYSEEEARSWLMDANAEFRNKDMNSPEYRIVPLIAAKTPGTSGSR
jgi:hypothetical protein